MFLFVFSNVSAGSFDEDINLECGPHLIAITQTMTQKLRSLGSQNGAPVTWDVTTLKKGQQAEDIGPYLGAILFDSEISFGRNTGLGEESFTIDRMQGLLTWHQNNYMDSGVLQNWVRKGPYKCKLSTRKKLNRKIESHNEVVRKTGPKRKF